MIEVTHRLYKGECLGYCDTKLIIDSNKIEYIQKGWDYTKDGKLEELPPIDSTYSITPEKWNKIISLITIDEVMKLDSAYMIDNEVGVSEGYFEIEITTSQRSKYIKFLNMKTIKAIDSLNNYLLYLREEL